MPETLLVRCPSCGSLNRASIEKLQQGLKPVCGKCKTGLAVDHPVIVTDESFATDVGKSEIPVLLDMWADWCGPCRMIAPAVNQLAREMVGRVRVAKLNIEENPVTPARYGVQSIPALLIFKDGEEIDRIVGAVPKSEILRRLDQVLARVRVN